MREKCGPISGIRKEQRIEESQRQDMFEAETVTLAVPVNERDHHNSGFPIRPDFAKVHLDGC